MKTLLPISGVTFSLTGYDFIPTDGSGRVPITDINSNENNDEEALICRSEIPISGDGVGDWYLHPTEMNTSSDHRIFPPPRRGWRRNRDDESGHRLVRLRRVSDTAEEGVLTCNIPGDTNTPRYLGVYYPSE